MSNAELGAVSVRKKGNEGEWFTLKNPNDEGQVKAKVLVRKDWLTDDGKPVQVKVRCADCDAVREAQRDVERNKIIDPDLALTTPDVKMIVAKAVLVNVRNLGYNGRSLGVKDEPGKEMPDKDKEELLYARSDIVEQVLEFSEDKKVFFGGSGQISPLILDRLLLDAEQIGYWQRVPKLTKEERYKGKLSVNEDERTHWERKFGNRPFILGILPIKSKVGIYLLNALSDLGWVSSNGFGISPIQPERLISFGELHSGVYKDWELSIIWQLSKAFVHGYNNGERVLAKSPYQKREKKNG